MKHNNVAISIFLSAILVIASIGLVSSFELSVPASDGSSFDEADVQPGYDVEVFKLWLSVTLNHCSGTVTAKATVSGGYEPYDFEWSLDDVTYVNGEQDSYDGIDTFSKSGFYGKSVKVYVKVTDSSGVIREDDNSDNPAVFKTELTVDLSVNVDQSAGVATFTADVHGGVFAFSIGSNPITTYTYKWDMNSDGDFDDPYDIISGSSTAAISRRGASGIATVHVLADYGDYVCEVTDSIPYKINNIAIGSCQPMFFTTLNSVNTMWNSLQAALATVEDSQQFAAQLDEIQAIVEHSSSGSNYVHMATSLEKTTSMIEDLINGMM